MRDHAESDDIAPVALPLGLFLCCGMAGGLLESPVLNSPYTAPTWPFESPKNATAISKTVNRGTLGAF